MTRFRVATYNIHKSRGIDWRVRPDRVAQVLREIDADVIALQEVVSEHVGPLSESLGMPHRFGVAETYRGQDYGNLLFSRFPIVSHENHDISVSGRERRACLQADLEVSGGAVLHIFAVHLGTSFFERRKQARKIVSAGVLGKAALTGPRILTGDFNEWTRGLATRLFGAQLKSADAHEHLDRRVSYPGVLPFLHLDHIYYDPSLTLTAMRLHRTQASLLASDHLPLVGDFELHRSDQTAS